MPKYSDNDHDIHQIIQLKVVVHNASRSRSHATLWWQLSTELSKFQICRHYIYLVILETLGDRRDWSKRYGPDCQFFRGINYLTHGLAFCFVCLFWKLCLVIYAAICNNPVSNSKLYSSLVPLLIQFSLFFSLVAQTSDAFQNGSNWYYFRFNCFILSFWSDVVDLVVCLSLLFPCFHCQLWYQQSSSKESFIRWHQALFCVLVSLFHNLFQTLNIYSQ